MHSGQNKNVILFGANGYLGFELSKYLKDIKKTRTNGTLTEVKVSDAIGHLVSQLAARLNAEANKTIEDMEQAFDKERKSWNQEKSGLEESLSQATEQNKALSDNIHSLQAKLNTASRESEQLNTELQGIQSDLKEPFKMFGFEDLKVASNANYPSQVDLI